MAENQSFIIEDNILKKYIGKDEIIIIPEGVIEIGQSVFSKMNFIKEVILPNSLKKIEEFAFEFCDNLKKVHFGENIEIIEKRAFYGVELGKVKLPKSVKIVERSSFCGTDELIVYDSIDPKANDAEKWEYCEWNGTVNSALSCAMLDNWWRYSECQGNTTWKDYYISVLSAEDNSVKYRIFCDSEENSDYKVLMFSAWGKNASFMFEKYDNYFLSMKNPKGRAKMAFCRIQYPYNLNEKNKKYYEQYIQQCMFIEKSAKQIMEVIFEDDNEEWLKILIKYNAINKDNIEMVTEKIKENECLKCSKILEEHKNCGGI